MSIIDSKTEGAIILESWIIYALLSALFAAFVSVFGKMGLTGIDSNVATAVRAVIMALFLIGVICFQGNIGRVQEIFSDKRSLLFIVLSGIAGALSWLFYFMALKHGKVSQVAPIDKLSVAFAVILSIVVLNESISPIHIFAIVLIVVGGLLMLL